MKNYLQLEVNGQKYGLKFNIGTFFKIQELGISDPFTFQPASESFGDVMEWFKFVVHAALLSNHECKGEDKTYTETEINNLVKGMSSADIKLVSDMYGNQDESKPSVNGEVVKDTQSNNLG